MKLITWIKKSICWHDKQAMHHDLVVKKTKYEKNIICVRLCAILVTKSVNILDFKRYAFVVHNTQQEAQVNKKYTQVKNRQRAKE